MTKEMIISLIVLFVITAFTNVLSTLKPYSCLKRL